MNYLYLVDTQVYYFSLCHSIFTIYIIYIEDVVVSRFYNDLWSFNIASSSWNWRGGTNNNSTGIFPAHIGEVGIPHARFASASWTSDDGLLFLFGGSELYGNDLWAFNTSSGNWTWKGGTFNGTYIQPNYPDSIGGVGWPGSTTYSAYCRLSNSAFIFGGYGMQKRF